MDLSDFLTAMKQIERLGPLEGLLKMLPGVNTKMLKQVKATDPKRMRHVEAIVLSMTPEERKNPEIMNGSRRARVAKGCGRPISEVNRLLEQFREMQKMMKKAGTAAGGAWEVQAEYVWSSVTQVTRSRVAIVISDKAVSSPGAARRNCRARDEPGVVQKP